MTSLDDYISEVEAGFPLTTVPQRIPEVQKHIVSWITCGTYKSFDKDYMNWFLEPIGVQVAIPKNALTVSFAMPNFVPGKSCQEFYPKLPRMPSGSFFTYRMLSKQSQATFYNEGGVEFLAGVGYYLQLKDSALITTDIDKFAMNDPVGSDFSYPHIDRRRTWRFEHQQRYGRDCKTAGKRVQVCFGEGRDHAHRVYNYRIKKFEYKECEECRQEAKSYMFVKLPVEPATVIESNSEQLNLEVEEETATVTQNPLTEVKEEKLTTSDDEFDFVEDIDDLIEL